MGESDVLFLTADHGNDPTTVSTDHSRERVPILATGNPIKAGTDIGTRKSFTDLAATIASMLKTEGTGEGDEFASLILKSENLN